MMILGYWLTNIVGLIMMHRGLRGLVQKDKDYHSRQAIIKGLIFSIIYTLIIVVLIKVGWLRFPSEYFNR